MPDSATQDDVIATDKVWRPWWVDPLAIVGMLCATVLLVLGSIQFFFVLLGTLAALAAFPDAGALALPLAISYLLAFGAYSPRARRGAWALASAAFILVFLLTATLAVPIGGALAVVGVVIVLISHALLYGGIRMAEGVGRMTRGEHWYAHHLRRGLCPRCRYNIRDLPEPRCPECGGMWSIEEDTTPDDARSSPS